MDEELGGREPRLDRRAGLAHARLGDRLVVAALGEQRLDEADPGGAVVGLLGEHAREPLGGLGRMAGLVARARREQQAAHLDRRRQRGLDLGRRRAAAEHERREPERGRRRTRSARASASR